MSAGTRRAALFVAGAALLGGMALWFGREDTRSGSGGSAQQGRSTAVERAEPPSRPRAAGASEAEPSVVPENASAPSYVILVRTLPSGEAAAGVPLRGEYRGGAVAAATSGADGNCRFEVRPLAVQSADPTWRVVGQDLRAEGGEVWATRMIEVSGTVIGADREPIAGVVVRCGPGYSDPAKWGALAMREGEPVWVRTKFPEILSIPATISGEGFRADVPTFHRVVVVASAHGYLPRAIVAPVDSGGARGLTIGLERTETVRVRVADEEGQPIRGARLTLHAARRGPLRDFDPAAEMAVQELSRSAFTAKTFVRSGCYELAHSVSGASNGDGECLLDLPAAGDEVNVVISSDGRPTRVVPRPAAGWKDGVDVVLPSVARRAESYRFTDDGKPLRRAAVFVCLRVGALTPTVASLVTDHEGRIPGGAVEPDRDFEVFVQVEGPGDVASGVLRFGVEPEIDVRKDLRPLPVDGR